MTFKTYEDVLNIEIPADFGPDEEFYDDPTETMEYLMDQLDPTVVTHWGISQFVILKKDWDRVVKIPFFGWFVYNQSKSDAHGEEIYDFVEYNIDYAASSYDLYEEAIDANIADIFAEMQILGKTKDGTTIYTQEAIEGDFDYFCDKEISSSHDSKELAREMRRSSTNSSWKLFNEQWLAVALDDYGYEFMNRLMNFLADHKLRDFHDGNYGFRKDGSAVIIDWAGFEED